MEWLIVIISLIIIGGSVYLIYYFNNHFYGKSGFNKKGFDKEGYDQSGYNHDGYDRKGYDKKGYNKKGYDEEGFNKKGLNDKGLYWWSLNIKENSIMEKQSLNKPTLKLSEEVNNKNIVKIINNAYNVLGLPSSSSTREINKRVSEQEKLINIKVNPTFEFDLFYKLISRDIKSVKEAAFKLQNNNDKLLQMFYWIDYDYEIVNKAMKNPLEIALHDLYQEYFEKKDVICLKNALLLSIIYSSLENEKKALLNTIPLWNEVIKSNIYWEFLEEKFLNSIDWKVESKIIEKFKESILKNLSELYYDVYLDNKWEEINIIFYDNFNVVSNKFYSEKITTKLNQLNESYEQFDNEKDILTQTKTVKKAFASNYNKFLELLTDTNKIINNYLFADKKTLNEINEKIALSLRSKSITIFNGIEKSNKGDYQFAKRMLLTAKDYAYSRGLTSKINEDLKGIEKEEKIEKSVEEILNDMKNKRFSSAQTKIEKLKDLDDSYSHQSLVRELFLALFKNQYNSQYNDAIAKANQLSEQSFFYHKDEIRRQLNLAIDALDLLYLIADKTNDESEKRKISSIKYDLREQLRKMSGGGLFY